MQLSQINYDFKTPTEIEILDPITGKSFDKPAFISIYSKESQQGKQAQVAIFREIIALKEAGEEIPEDTLKQIALKYIPDLVSGWRGIEDDKGKAIKYSKAKAVELLTQYDHLFNIVNNSSAIAGNYLKK